MVHPHTELRLVNDVIGHGVFATRFLPKGTIVWVRDDLDQAFTPQEVMSMPPVYQDILEKYSFVDARGMVILCWDHSRFFNHSCDANCMSAGYDFEIAVRDIQAGEELTDDYGTLNIREHFECRCDKVHCRKQVGPEDFARFAASWDAKVREAFFLINSVPQPLWSLVKEQQDVQLALANPTLLRSILAHCAPAA